MVCSNITVDNDEAGFKHNSNEILTAVVAFGNESIHKQKKSIIIYNIYIIIAIDTQFFKDHERTTSLFVQENSYNDTYYIRYSASQRNWQN